MKKLKEKFWTNEIQDKVAFTLAVATIVIPLFLLVGIMGGIEMGTIELPFGW